MPRLRRAALALVLCALLTPFALSALAGHATVGTSPDLWLAWRTETVDAEEICSSGTTGLVIDPQGEPHAAYTRAIPGVECRVWYTHRQGALWTPPVSIPTRGYAGGIDLDSQGNVHFAIEDGRAKYAVGTGTGPWTVETIEVPVKGVIRSIRIAVDAQDTPHVMFSYFGADLKYAQRTSGGTWNIELVDPQGAGAVNWAMALDSKGQPHVAYGSFGTSGGILKYAYRSPQGAWVVETLRKDCGSEVGFALDAQDRPHISCYQYIKGLLYVHYDGQGWASDLVHGGVWSGRETSIAVDSRGIPHISYGIIPSSSTLALNTGQLHYASKDSFGGWSWETVDHVGNYNGLKSNLKLDKHDRPHIAYYLGWWRNTGGEDAANHAFDFMYAEPVAATVLAPVERLLGAALP